MRSQIFLLVLVLAFSTAAVAQDTGPANGSNGSPLAYTVMGKIEKLPNDGRPRKKIAFPEISDWRSLRITLERGLCFGNCPAYRVEIRGDGTVSFDAEASAFVAVAGPHKARIPEQDVRDLFAAFRKADFFWLLDAYRAPISDFPDNRIAIAFDTHEKSVNDYIGQAVGMPKAVLDLEQTIDRLAGTRKWVAGDATTFASLNDEGWDFHATDDAHLKLLLSAADVGSIDLLKQLLEAGVPASNPFGCRALDAAVRKSDTAGVQMLLAAKAPVFISDKQHGDCIPLMEAARRDDPGIVTALLDAGADPYVKDDNGKTALDFAQDGQKTALVLKAWLAAHPQKQPNSLANGL
jgi:Domain of unknown function (DUF6438)/Ankyrin repeats (3 copies)